MLSQYPLHPRARYGWGAPPEPAMHALLEAAAPDYTPTVAQLGSRIDWYQTIPRIGGELSWVNPYWGGVDAVAQCTFLAERDPATYLEIGSGFSTLFARTAIESFGLRTRIVSIDPVPRAEISAVCDEAIRAPFEDTDLSRFASLQPGDVVLVDCSHTAFMNSDATVFFLEVLPRIPAGVLVGVDDIFLPWDYPTAWTDRWYGEQYLLAAWLLGGHEGWSIRFPAFHVTAESSLAGKIEPLWPLVAKDGERYAMSFWIERR